MLLINKDTADVPYIMWIESDRLKINCKTRISLCVYYCIVHIGQNVYNSRQ